jgi:hypothetical protein
MAEPRDIAVADLALDLRNYRTVHQRSEKAALQAMVSASPDRFWALMNSLLEDRYLPTERILVLNDTHRRQPTLTVKEGNRRVAALKLAHGLLKIDASELPDDVRRQLDDLSEEWIEATRKVPCFVYGVDEAQAMDRVVARSHGKGEKAGRDQWNAVARARHNRDARGVNEPGLDTLEKYLAIAQGISRRHADQWAGDFPLTVLDEALKRIAPSLSYGSGRELAAAYPNIPLRKEFDNIIEAIGLRQISFGDLRSKDDGKKFPASYGIPPKSLCR